MHQYGFTLKMKSKIRLYGFTDNDRKVFISLLSILSYKTEKEWIISDEWGVDVVIIDINCDPQQLKIDKLKATGHKVVVYGDSEKVKGFDLVLHRPLRAADILQSLRLTDDKAISTIQNTNITQTLYQLKRWPPKAILVNVAHSSRLCAALLKKPISSEHLARAVNLPIEDVETFINSCQRCACIQITYATEIIDAQPLKKNNIALFDRIRQKFSVRTSRG